MARAATPSASPASSEPLLSTLPSVPAVAKPPRTSTPTPTTSEKRSIRAGDAVLSPRLAGFVLDAFSGELTVTDPELDQLTVREREVLRLIARGYAYKEVAARLHLSVKTIETHVSAVLRKLQLSSRHELTVWAADRRLL